VLAALKADAGKVPAALDSAQSHGPAVLPWQTKLSWQAGRLGRGCSLPATSGGHIHTQATEALETRVLLAKACDDLCRADKFLASQRWSPAAQVAAMGRLALIPDELGQTATAAAIRIF